MQMTADQIVQAMEEMENGERIKLLAILSHKHFGLTTKEQLDEFIEEKGWENY